MNIIYETTKERGATILLPTAMVDSMNPAIALALAGRPPEPPPARSAPAPAPRRRTSVPTSPAPQT
jgi:hypothetical protein